MQINLSTWGPMTVLLVIVVAIVLGIGGVVVVVHPETLTFRQYLDDLKTFALAVAALGGAKALKNGLIFHGQGHPIPPEPAHPPSPVAKL